jgi:hypothetical protein
LVQGCSTRGLALRLLASRGYGVGGLACGIKYDNGKREMEMGGVTREGIREIQAGCGALGWS